MSRFKFLKSKSIFLLTLAQFGLFTLPATAQVFENELKNLFSARITNLSFFEGIYEINSISINNYSCGEKRSITFKDKIAIYYEEGTLKAVSLYHSDVIGIINKGYVNGFKGQLFPDGLSRYPYSRISTKNMDGSFEISFHADINKNEIHKYLFPNEIKNEILRQINKCSYVSCPEDICTISMQYNFNRIYPNSNEPPITPESQGSGVVISKEGYILTNRHVVEKTIYEWDDNIGSHSESRPGWKILDGSNSSNKYWNISQNITGVINNIQYELLPIVLFNTNIHKNQDGSKDTFYESAEINEDLILLKIIGNPPKDIPFVVIDTTAGELGREVYSLGYPLSRELGSNLLYTNGYYSNRSNHKSPINNEEIINIDVYNMGVNPGNSGGGIFDKSSGHLVGIATSRINDEKLGLKTEGIAFATVLNNISRILKNHPLICHMASSSAPDLSLQNNKLSENTFWDPSRCSTINSKVPILIKDDYFNPVITLQTNKKSTVMIFTH